MQFSIKKYLESPLPLILVFLISTCISVLLNIPVYRQILGSIFLGFIPGFLILCITKLDRLELHKKFVLSIGLSISFVMLMGLIINTLYPLISYETPLSPKSIVISFTFIMLILAVIANSRGGLIFSFKQFYPKFDQNDKAFLLIPSIFPLLSIIGMHLMNAANNNAILIIFLFLIPIYVIIISICRDQISEKTYPIIIFLISISLVLLWGMRSSHIIGTDAHLEYIVFKQTFINEKWQILRGYSIINSCLSVSILPTAYQSILNINPECLFKVLYPLLFSISPIVIYIITKNYANNFSAFLASIFFMSQKFYIITAASPRTNIAILFFALSMMILLLSEISEMNKKLFLIIFIISCILSHYSTTYVFFVIFFIAWLSMRLIHKIILHPIDLHSKNPQEKNENAIIDFTSQYKISRISESFFSLGILMIFFISLFLWFNMVVSSPFDRGVGFIIETLNSMQHVFLIESRDSGISAAFGYGIIEKGLLSKIIFVISWQPIICIAIGIMSALTRFRHRITFLDNSDSPNCLSRKIDLFFIVLGLICFCAMASMVVLPYVSQGYDVNRLFLQMAVVLSTFLIIGGLEISRFFHIKYSYLVLIVVIISFFSLNTGLLQNIAGVPASIAIDSHGPSYDDFYIHEQETMACNWLGKNLEAEKEIYTDVRGKSRLISQGMIPVKSIGDLPGFLQGNRDFDGYIYLRYFNVINRNLSVVQSSNFYRLNEFEDFLSMQERIYDNSGSILLMDPISKHAFSYSDLA